MATPVTHYAKSYDVHVAYQVFGSGPIDLIFVPGFSCGSQRPPVLLELSASVQDGLRPARPGR